MLYTKSERSLSLRKLEQVVLILLILIFIFSSIVTIFSAEPSAGSIKIGLVTYDGTAWGPITDTAKQDDVATYNYLVGKGYDVTVIHQWALDSGNPTYYKLSYDWQVFDLVIIPGAIYSGWNMTELVSSKVPVITMNHGYADELGLANGNTMHSDISVFNVVDNSHYITRQLSLGILPFASPMWTDASDNTGFNSTVLVDSSVGTQGILIVHDTKKYVYFGWYKTYMMSSEGWDLLERTVHWTLSARGTAFSWTVTAVGIEAWTDNGEEKNTPVNGTQSGRGTVSPYKDYVGWYSIGLTPQNDGRISKESMGVSVESDGKINVMISIVSIEYYGKEAVISGEVRGITKVETTDEGGTEMKNRFGPHQTVYIMGGGFESLTTYPLHVVNDTDWIHGMSIPERVQGTKTNVTTDWNGNIATEIDRWTFPRGTAWTWPLKIGAYDILIDVNGNGIFDKGVDALDYYQTAGFIVEADATNLAVIPTAWQGGYYQHYSNGTEVPPYVFIDNTVVYNGNLSLRLQTGGDIDPFGVLDRATWTRSYSVKLGDHIVARAWMKTDPSSLGDKDMGARIGVDFRGNEIILTGYPGPFVPEKSEYVHWGTATWTMRQYDFIVPNTIYTTDQTGETPIPPTQIDTINMWAQARPAEDAGNVWIANAELYINPPITLWALTPPPIESCDSIGAPKSVFSSVDTVYVNGSGYPVSPLLDIYIVADTTWSDGMPIPSRVPGTATYISSDSNGKIPPTAAWNGPLVPGKYDIVIDINQNGKFDAGIDALLSNRVEVTAGFFVIPELHLGTVTTLLLLLMLAALVLFAHPHS